MLYPLLGLSPLSLCNTFSFLSSIKVFVLNSVLVDVSTAIQLPFCFHLHQTYFPSLSFPDHVCLWVWSESFVGSINGFYFLIHSTTLCHLIRPFSLLAFKLIIDNCVLIVIVLIAFRFLLFSLLLPSSGAIAPCDLMTIVLFLNFFLLCICVPIINSWFVVTWVCI